jgi:hypothetical protein
MVDRTAAAARVLMVLMVMVFSFVVGGVGSVRPV